MSRNSFGTPGVSALMLVVVAACSSSDATRAAGGAAEPEKALRAFADATSDGDLARMRRLLVSPARIQRALTCRGAETLVRDVEETFAGLDALRGAGAAALREVTIALTSVDERDRVTVAKGDTFHGCTAREPFEARTYRVQLDVRHLPPGESGLQLQEVILLDGVWWMLPAA